MEKKMESTVGDSIEATKRIHSSIPYYHPVS